MTAIGIALAAGSAIGSAVGQTKAGRAAKAVGESAAQREEFNARVAEMQAQDAVARGATEAATFRSGVRRLVGSQRAGFAGQGVVVGQGSAADVQADATYLGERDAQQILHNADREAWGFRMEAEDRRYAADVARRGGQASSTASKIGATQTLLGAGSSLLLSRYGWDNSEAPRGVRRPAYGTPTPNLFTIPRI